jgi:hypothetical protein
MLKKSVKEESTVVTTSRVKNRFISEVFKHRKFCQNYANLC